MKAQNTLLYQVIELFGWLSNQQKSVDGQHLWSEDARA
jgi:hypothetical protein